MVGRGTGIRHDTPGEYLTNMVDVFRLVRDVLADDGCIWVNMGDCYAGSRCGGETGASTLGGSRESQEQSKLARASFRRDRKVTPRSDIKVAGIKPKDLVGMPWRLAIALQEDGWWLRSDIIWHKPNPMPESCTDRPTKSHEYLFLLAKSEIYYYDADAIKEPASEDTHARYARGRSDTHKWADGGPGDQTIAKSFEHMRDDRQIHKPVAGWATGDYFHDAVSHAKAKDERHGKLLKHPGNGVGFGHGYDENVKPRVAGVTPKSAAPDSGIRANESFHAAVGAIVSTRNRRTVWTIPTEPFPGAHFATFPTALVEPCILAGSRVGDVVLDPFMGSGTVAQVALELGRRWVGCELNSDYAAMQAGRTRQTGLAFG
jgi:DNA modification methylase